MLTVVVNNSNKKDEIDFKERVREVMIKQIKKKFFGASKPNLLNVPCDAPFTTTNSIQQ